MKRLLIILFVLLASTTFAQKMYVTRQPYDADVKIYVVRYPHQADVIVYQTDRLYLVNSEEGYTWFYTKDRYYADKKIYFTKYEFQADLKVYFCDYPFKRKWINEGKRYLLK